MTDTDMTWYEGHVSGRVRLPASFHYLLTWPSRQSSVGWGAYELRFESALVEGSSHEKTSTCTMETLI